MKIIGTTASGYLVEATAIELAKAAGYSTPDRCPGWTPSSRYYGAGDFQIGTELLPTEAAAYLEKLRTSQESVKKSELILRALADMLHGALPETIIPPDAPAADAAS